MFFALICNEKVFGNGFEVCVVRCSKSAAVRRVAAMRQKGKVMVLRARDQQETYRVGRSRPSNAHSTASIQQLFVVSKSFGLTASSELESATPKIGETLCPLRIRPMDVLSSGYRSLFPTSILLYDAPSSRRCYECSFSTKDVVSSTIQISRTWTGIPRTCSNHQTKCTGRETGANSHCIVTAGSSRSALRKQVCKILVQPSANRLLITIYY